MALKDILKKKDKTRDEGAAAERGAADDLAPPEFRIFRSDTQTEERIHPPTFNDPPADTSASRNSNIFSRLRRSSNASSTQSATYEPSPVREKDSRRLSQRLHIDRRSRSTSTSSANLPADLPQIGPDNGDAQEREAQWEKRATMLVQGNSHGQRPGSSLSTSAAHVNETDVDADLQEAIRLHEEGALEQSTRIFGRLADPDGPNHTLSQVLYGLALRHGWGCAPDPQGAVTYLSAAASNSASIESEALKAGMKKGGTAKGELVLAIFELANCFRYGWGVAKDPVAARNYYETAANLGDTDAMNEAAWCFVEGVGGKKDKVCYVLTAGSFSYLVLFPSGKGVCAFPSQGRLPTRGAVFASISFPRVAAPPVRLNPHCCEDCG
ncbi:hypothetical protein AJ80_01564 [Polytolypa hystricis UAMH7299]|uniref:Protein DSF2 n=1 Tax=Polytolypa hystricis (strain UAMH7299) TaxID=1447883 RepID=A0A2B7Z0Z5_POLH7|nr:hypothetical protein AJ80_01564 [Polytolypa hystricis UAMH7299]